MTFEYALLSMYLEGNWFINTLEYFIRPFLLFDLLATHRTSVTMELCSDGRISSTLWIRLRRVTPTACRSQSWPHEGNAIWVATSRSNIKMPTLTQAGYSDAAIAFTSFFICTTCLTMAMTPVYTLSPERSSSAVGCERSLLSDPHFLVVDHVFHTRI